MLKATIAFDFRPLATNLSRIADYTSTILYSAVSAQLFRWHEKSRTLLPAACRSMRSNCDSTEYQFSLEPGLSWFDGSPVTAGQYAARLEDVVNSCAPIWTRLDHLTGIDAQRREDRLGNEEEVIRIRLRSPDKQLSNKLAHPSFGPLKIGDGANEYPDAAGPFIFCDLNDSGGTLRCRSAREQGFQPSASIDFRFVLEAEDAVSLYLRGELDSTCPVSFPLDRVDEFATHRDFLRCPVTTFFVLMPISARAQSGPLRQALRASINFHAIADVQPAGLSPWWSFAPQFSRQQDEIRTARPDHRIGDASIGDLKSDFRIRLALEDFQPNRKIATTLSAQIKGLGGQVEEIIDRFGKPSAECDFRLCVLSNSTSYPVDLYRRLSLSPIISVDPALRLNYGSLIQRFDCATDDDARAAVVARLDEIIWRELPVIPVANLGQFCLKRDKLAGFDWGGDASWLTL